MRDADLSWVQSGWAEESAGIEIGGMGIGLDWVEVVKGGDVVHNSLENEVARMK